MSDDDAAVRIAAAVQQQRQQRQQLERLLAPAAAVLRDACAAPDAAIGAPELLRDRTRSVVARVRVRGVPALASAIVKAATADDATFYDEWASLAFLAELPAARDVVPRWVGGDRGARLFVLGDLGGSRSLDDVLREPRRASALHALAALGRATAELHAATLGAEARAHEARFRELRAALPGGPAHDRATTAERWEHDAAETLAAWCAALGVAADSDAGLDLALRAVADAYREPGDFLAFTHGDPAPSNNHVAPSSGDAGGDVVRLLDFEYGGFRHALYDPSAWAVLCPLPADGLAAVRDAFRAELATRAPSSSLAGTTFDAAWAAMACWRAVAILGWLGAAAVVESNASWVDGWTRREAALAACDRVAESVAAAPGAAALYSLGTTAAALAAAMRTRWPEYAERPVVTHWQAFDAAD